MRTLDSRAPPPVDAHARAGQLHQARALIRRMERGEAGREGDAVSESAPDVVSYTILISGLARRGKLNEAARWLEHMRTNTTVVPDATTFNTMVAGYASRGMWAAVTRLFGEMREEGVKPDQWTYGPLL